MGRKGKRCGGLNKAFDNQEHFDQHIRLDFFFFWVWSNLFIALNPPFVMDSID